MPATIAPTALVGCDPDAAVTALGGETMGTRWNVRLVAPAGCDPAAVRAAIVARLDAIVAAMSHWEPGSLLSRFNRQAAGGWTRLPPDFLRVMTQGLAIAAATHGAFDPAIGQLVDLWGFGPVPVAGPPAGDRIAAARASSGWRRLTLADGWLRQPGGLGLDLSGIAKGHAVDAVADLLATMGVTDALVEIGGELVGRGVRPDGQPWWVDLEVPPGTDIAPLRIALHGLAVATSGDYVRGAHTLDPRTGRPIANGVVAASVVHASALVADAWATALCVAGPAAGLALARNAEIAGRIVAMYDGEAREYLSPALAAMLADD
ncbi:FAD:protein FMN transferase [Sphingomonas sp. CROZ-RG-20F-R02-07]|uniref:FAD:protein FMN transferase n=1 Tax=Sphingomonas sp. CROZ-RG-20F-R02-07 TaxID=2914832 RepID=UPI001F567AE1|nr:FAD:protein FMN transferase [Sphingomonas sp. CROZ-RG-20F-R02-07]